jgi:hypothetical protein
MASTGLGNATAEGGRGVGWGWAGSGAGGFCKMDYLRTLGPASHRLASEFTTANARRNSSRPFRGLEISRRSSQGTLPT